MSQAEALVVPADRLENFPVTFFAVPMGLFGFTLALHAAELTFRTGTQIAMVALAVAAAVLGLVSAFYLAKLARHRSAVVHEWNHPVRVAFFPAASIAFLLLAAALVDVSPALANIVWTGATVAQGALALSVISAWIGHRPFQPVHLSPAWFIPAVGNVVVPVAGVPLGHADISWLFFSAGLVFWIVLLTLVVNRLMFHDPLPGRMVPTLTILIAPPAVAYVAWLRLAGEPGPFGLILLNLAYVFAAIVAMQAMKMRKLPFALSWWALSFPVAAASIASFAHARAAGSHGHALIGAAFLALLAAIILVLAVRTARAITERAICVPE